MCHANRAHAKRALVCRPKAPCFQKNHANPFVISRPRCSLPGTGCRCHRGGAGPLPAQAQGAPTEVGHRLSGHGAALALAHARDPGGETTGYKGEPQARQWRRGDARRAGQRCHPDRRSGRRSPRRCRRACRSRCSGWPTTSTTPPRRWWRATAAAGAAAVRTWKGKIGIPTSALPAISTPRWHRRAAGVQATT